MIAQQRDQLLFTFNSQQLTSLTPSPLQPPKPVNNIRFKKLKSHLKPKPSTKANIQRIIQQEMTRPSINKLMSLNSQMISPGLVYQGSYQSQTIIEHREKQIQRQKQPRSMHNLDMHVQSKDLRSRLQENSERNRTQSLRLAPRVDFKDKKLPQAFRLKSISHQSRRQTSKVIYGECLTQQKKIKYAQCLTQQRRPQRTNSRYTNRQCDNGEDSPRFN